MIKYDPKYLEKGYENSLKLRLGKIGLLINFGDKLQIKRRVSTNV